MASTGRGEVIAIAGHVQGKKLEQIGFVLPDQE
jgi:hypothetical protein